MTSPDPGRTSADSLTVAGVVIEALLEAGLRDVVVCPGSRSAPLVYALACAERSGRLRVHVRIDERSAGFLAHGLSLASGRLVGVLTTSGSAAGNLLPALMESWHAGTRVVALTADRPAALHGTGANQTTAQEGLFPHHVRAAAAVRSLEPGATAAQTGAHLDAVRATVQRIALAAEGFSAPETAAPGGGTDAPVLVEDAPSGPVHLNLEFAEPLVPDAAQLEHMARTCRQAPPALPDTGPAPGLDAHPATGVLPDLSTHPSVTGAPAAARCAPAPPWRPPGTDLSGFPHLEQSGLPRRSTVVLAAHDAGPVAAAFALALGLPVLAEPSSNARFTLNAVAAYPLLLGAGGGRGEGAHPLAARIERVVLFGRPTLTRPVAALLARQDVATAVFEPEPPSWYEPGRRRELPCETLAELAAFAGRGPSGWLHEWQRASRAAQAAIEDVLLEEDAHGLGPAHAAMTVAAAVHGPLVLGSSSLIRDVDLTWRPPTTPHSHVFANRGLAGIDGTVSTAAGVALALQRRTVALLGDLTALHEAGGLLVPTGEPDPDVDLVVVNDSGGAIFASLEHGEVARAEGMAAVVERLFGTPQDVDLASLAAAYGAAHTLVDSSLSLQAALATPASGRRIIEVRCDRADRARTHRRLVDAVRATYPTDDPAPQEERP